MDKFLLNSKNINKSTYIWNMIGSMLNAFQSVIFLMILTRVTDLSDSGVFTIAFADANLFLLIGKYGVRYFHASDASGKYDFTVYRKTRWITTVLMLCISFAFTMISSKVIGYSTYKSMVILWMCIFKLPDSIEDVYYGEYQRRGRLDVASKAWSIRLILTSLVFGLALVITKDLLKTLIITTILTSVLMVILIWQTKPLISTATKLNEENTNEGKGNEQVANEKLANEQEANELTGNIKCGMGNLFLECAPLFISTFLSFYVLNAPKYSIDALMTDEIQAKFGFVAMPVFVVSLLTSMMYNPVIQKLSVWWARKQVKDFNHEVWKQMLYVVIVTLVCLLGAFLIGIPVLSLLYNTDLRDYKFDLMVMLIGGDFLGASNWLNAVLTIMRKQNYMLIGYGLVSLLALIFMNLVTGKYGVNGVSVLFSLLMLLLMFVFIAIYLIGLRRRKHE